MFFLGLVAWFIQRSNILTCDPRISTNHPLTIQHNNLLEDVFNTPPTLEKKTQTNSENTLPKTNIALPKGSFIFQPSILGFDGVDESNSKLCCWRAEIS